jgi:hypothetical protein
MAGHFFCDVAGATFAVDTFPDDRGAALDGELDARFLRFADQVDFALRQALRCGTASIYQGRRV